MQQVQGRVSKGAPRTEQVPDLRHAFQSGMSASLISLAASGDTRGSAPARARPGPASTAAAAITTSSIAQLWPCGWRGWRGWRGSCGCSRRHELPHRVGRVVAQIRPSQ